MAALNFSNMFDAFLEGAEKDWKYDRNASVGASEAFACIRQVYFKKFQYDVDDGHEQDWGAAKRGDIIENHFAVPATKAIVEKVEGLLLYAGDEQDTLKSGRLTATPDGLIVDLDADALAQLGIPDIESDCVVIEYKSFDPRATIKEEKAIHAGQVQVQMGLFHEKTEFRPEYAVIVYFNASWLSDIRPFVVKRDAKIYAAAKERAQRVFATEDPADLMAEGKLSGGCTYCEFTQECAYTTGEATPKTKKKIEDQEVMDRLALLAGRQKQYAATEADAKAEKKLVEEEIKEILRKADTKGASDDRFQISNSWCAGKKSLDTLLLAAELEELGKSLEDFQSIGNGYERLTVKLKDAVE